MFEQYDKPVTVAHGADHFFLIDQPLSDRLFSRVQPYGGTRFSG
jgi:hypothetical protein